MAQTLHAALKERHRVDGVAEYRIGTVFQPGAGVGVYTPDFSDPVCSMIGSATRAGLAPNPFARPVVLTAPNRIVSGMGIQLGTFAHGNLEGGG